MDETEQPVEAQGAPAMGIAPADYWRGAEAAYLSGVGVGLATAADLARTLRDHGTSAEVRAAGAGLHQTLWDLYERNMEREQRARAAETVR